VLVGGFGGKSGKERLVAVGLLLLPSDAGDMEANNIEICRAPNPIEQGFSGVEKIFNPKVRYLT